MTNTKQSKEKQDLYSILVQEVKEKVQKLKDLGISKEEIASLLHPEQQLITLTVSRNYKMYLGGKRIEVKMEPIVKAVYLLFLKHPEGIIFKDLPDYRQELTKIYSEIRPWGLTDRAIQSIEDVTNPLLNSINEKCTRVKKAFLGILADEIAKHYYIKGSRGEAKGIALPRNMVIWE